MQVDMNDLAEQIAKSPNGEVIYWNCFLEQTSMFNTLYETTPELVSISLKSLSKPFAQVSDFEAKSLKTGERSYLRFSVFSVYLYNDRESCVKAYNELVYKCIIQSKREREGIVKQLDQRVDRLERSFIDSDYLIEKLIHSK